ncbi:MULTISPECIES: EexN family lipoprotein [Bartonella]|uniref:EexN family lipoprotein n=1 Tax=Bartonella TaxID=773 RepID=UPI00235F9CAE
MNKVIITALLLCTGAVVVGCEESYSVEDFKKDEKLFKEYAEKCGWTGNSKSCKNMRLADREFAEERRKKADERYRKYRDEYNRKQMENLNKMTSEEKKRKSEQKAKE